MKKKIKLFEAFAWIWSQYQALKNLKLDIEVVWISDWYINAILAYWVTHLSLIPQNIDREKTIIFLKEYNLSRNSKDLLKTFSWITNDQLSIIEQVIKKYWELDITKIKGDSLQDLDIDIFTYSFPCQSISSQWKQEWFKNTKEEDKKTRSGLLWEVERILKEIKTEKLPKILLMENVKALLWKKFQNDLDSWIKELESLWYITTKPFVLNSASLWSPQSRDRVFMVSILKDEIKDGEDFLDIFSKSNIEKDIKNINKKFINDIYNTKMEHELFDLKKWKIKLRHNINKKETSIKKWELLWYTNFNSEKYFYYLDWHSPTITSTWALSKIKVWNGKNIEILNSFEHLLLQWFNNKNYYNKMLDIWISKNAIKFLAWNSINIIVLEYIFSKIIKYIKI